MAWLIIVIATICLFGMTAWADHSLPPAARLPIAWHWDGEPSQMSPRRVSLYFLLVLGGISFMLLVLFGPSRWHAVVVPAVVSVLAQLFSIFRLWRWFRRGMKQGWYAAPGGLNRPHG